MERRPVKSSNIKSIGYSETDKCLEVEFINGGIYEYYKVPKESYVSLMGADSHGKYLNQFIKKVFVCKKVS